eukprot:Amastigsp_a344432_10.p3 type:complete len:134 gc:universal Amastigsp_a344432_10:594-193(-)
MATMSSIDSATSGTPAGLCISRTTTRRDTRSQPRCAKGRCRTFSRGRSPCSAHMSEFHFSSLSSTRRSTRSTSSGFTRSSLASSRGRSSSFSTRRRRTASIMGARRGATIRTTRAFSSFGIGSTAPMFPSART